jgi:uncharacterized protein YbjT (DUF2867 family)
MPQQVFVTGGTGYMGTRLIRALRERGHAVRALARAASRDRVPGGCEVVIGDALDASTYVARVAPADTFVHLVGVAHPSPSKAAQFRDIDLRSARASVAAARQTGCRHFVYVSVAQPAPVMPAYQQARRAGEDAIRAAGLDATILRPWYVLGPGHWWPVVLVPAYAVLARLPATRDTARRLGLVTIAQMVRALVDAVEHPATGVRVVDVPAIRAGGGRPIADAGPRPAAG